MGKLERVNQYLSIRHAFYLINLITFILILLPALSADIPLWWLDNLLSLQLQWSLLAVLLTLINVKYVPKCALPFALLYLMVIGYNQLPFYLSAENKLQNQPLFKMTQLKIAQLNIRYENTHMDKLTAAVSSPDFDVLVLQEAADYQHKKIKALSRYYPYSIGIEPLESTPSGLALFSRWPIVERKIHNLGYKGGHILEVIIQAPETETPVQIFALHPASPRSEKLWQLRNATLAYTSELVSSSSLPNKIVIGDFNSTPWSGQFKYLQKNSRLKNSAEGFGYIASWSYSAVNYVMRLLSSAYIDHCLVSSTFTVLNKQYQRVQGSDHLLLLTELAVESTLQKDLHYAKKR